MAGASGITSSRTAAINEAETAKLLKSLKELPNVIAIASVEALQAVGFKIEQTAKDNHPYEDRTGNLTRSIYSKVVSEEKQKPVGYVGATMHYARYVEKGTARARAYPYLNPALIAVMKGAVGMAILKDKMGALRIAQGLKTIAPTL